MFFIHCTMKKDDILISSRVYRLQSIDSNERYYIINSLTLRIFCLDKIPYDIFIFLQESKSIKDILLKFEQIDESSITKLLEYLLKQEIIYHDDNEKDETFQIISKNETIFSLPKASLRDENEQIIFVGIPFGGGNTISNYSQHASSILRKYIKQYKINFNIKNHIESLNRIFSFDINSKKLIQLIEKERIKDLGDLFYYGNESNSAYYGKINKISNYLFRNKNIPIFIGGDHSITYPILQSANDNFNDIVVIHLDAHTDTYENEIDKIYNNNETIHHHGNFALFSMCLSNVIAFHQFGIRGLANIGIEEVSPKQNIYTIKESKQIINGNRELNLPKTANYYITIDVDVISPYFISATATPVPNGLSINDIDILLTKLLKDKNIIGVDFVEFNNEKATNDTAIQVSIEILFLLLKNLITNVKI